MAYTPINWATGDTITADKLNKMDNGWGYESTLLFSETVTTEDDGDGFNTGTLAYVSLIDAGTITVTFDGTDYTCSNIAPFAGIGEYGAPWSDELEGYDFSDYPFHFASSSNFNSLATETAGTHTIAAGGNAIVTSSDFDAAAQAAVAPSIAAIPTPYLVTVGTTTMQEVFDAIGAGKIPIIVYNENIVNNPRYIEIILYARKYNLTVNSVTISNGTVTVKRYTAQSADSPIVASS